MTSQTKHYFIALGGAIIIAALIWWGQNQKETQTQEPIRIGVMAPLSGPLASLGKGALQGFEMAIKETNDQGGIHNQPIELQIEDTAGDAKQGINVFNKLVEVNKINIIAQLFIARVEVPLVPIAREKDVFFLAHSFHPAIANNTPHIWRHSSTMEEEAKAAVGFFTEKGYKTIGIIAINDDYGIELARQVRAQVEASDIQVVIEERHETTASDFRAIITKVATAKPQAIFISSAGTLSGVLLKQIHELNYSGAILASAGIIFTPDALITAGDAKKGIYFNDLSIVYTDQFKAFSEKYEAIYKEETPRAAAIAYGSAELLIKLLQENDDSPAALSKAMTERTSFQGSLETMTILPNGNVSTPVVVKQF